MKQDKTNLENETLHHALEKYSENAKTLSKKYSVKAEVGNFYKNVF